MAQVRQLVLRMRAVLQNPALVLTVLATRPDAVALLRREVRGYLTDTGGADGAGGAGEDPADTDSAVEDAVLANSFLLHTPMNEVGGHLRHRWPLTAAATTTAAPLWLLL